MKEETVHVLDTETAEKITNDIRSMMVERDIKPERYAFTRTNDGRISVYRKKYCSWSNKGGYVHLPDDIDWIEGEWVGRGQYVLYADPEKQ